MVVPGLAYLSELSNFDYLHWMRILICCCEFEHNVLDKINKNTKFISNHYGFEKSVHLHLPLRPPILSPIRNVS